MDTNLPVAVPSHFISKSPWSEEEIIKD